MPAIRPRRSLRSVTWVEHFVLLIRDSTAQPRIFFNDDSVTFFDELARTRKVGITILGNDLGQPVSQWIVRKELQAFGEANGEQVVPHGLRKNAVNALLEAGCTAYEVMAITGQSLNIVEHYARGVNQRRLGEAAIIKLERKTPKGERA